MDDYHLKLSLVPRAGLEPARAIAHQIFESSAVTNSATAAQENAPSYRMIVTQPAISHKYDFYLISI